MSRFSFLDKSVGLSTPIEMSSDFLLGAASKFVETSLPLPVAGIEGLVVPSKCRGQVLRMIDKNCALVRWEVNGFCILVFLDHAIFLHPYFLCNC